MNIKFRIGLFPAALLTFMVAVTFTSCYYDKADIVYPHVACDTTSVTYSASIVPILNANCNVCHAGTAVNGGGINLDTYTGASTQAKNGRMLGAVQHHSGFSAMPKGGSMLSDCDIAKIRIWTSAGAPNN